jgi:hypothetical protein
MTDEREEQRHPEPSDGAISFTEANPLTGSRGARVYAPQTP